MDNKKKISVFIPIYNGSSYLEETLNSILAQTYKNFEVFCVDDSSTDDSYQVIKSYSQKDNRIKVYKKENGGTVPKSWNYILPELDGDLIFYMSQDDLISEDLFEKMIETHIKTGCDTVIPDMTYYYGCAEDKILSGYYGNKDIVLDGRTAVISSLDWSIHGFVLRVRSLYDNEVFPEDSINSDEFMTRKLFHKSSGIAFSDGMFKYRKNNKNAITNTFSSKSYTTLYTLLRLFKLLNDNGYDAELICLQLKRLLRTFFIFSALNKLNIGIKNKNQRNQVEETLLNVSEEIKKINKNICSKNLSILRKTQIRIMISIVHNCVLLKVYTILVCLKYYKYSRDLSMNSYSS